VSAGSRRRGREPLRNSEQKWHETLTYYAIPSTHWRLIEKTTQAYHSRYQTTQTRGRCASGQTFRPHVGDSMAAQHRVDQVGKVTLHYALVVDVKSNQAAATKERKSRDTTCQPDSAQGIGAFRSGGTRPPRQVILAFIDAHRDQYEVESIRKLLPDCPSTYYEHKAPSAMRSCLGRFGEYARRTASEWCSQSREAVTARTHSRASSHRGAIDASGRPKRRCTRSQDANADCRDLCEEPLDRVQRRFVA